MLGIIERVGEGLEMVGLAIGSVILEVNCKVTNKIVDVKCQHKIRQIQKECLESGSLEDDVAEESAEES